MRAARLAGSASPGNQALRYHLGLVNPFSIDRAKLNPHGALSDATVTAAIFFEVTKHANWPQLVQWSYEPALLTYLRVGMHRWERFDAAPEDCLRWQAEGAHDLTEDVRFSAGIGLTSVRKVPRRRDAVESVSVSVWCIAMGTKVANSEDGVS